MKIEFVEPIRENSVVSKFHSQNPASPIHHLAIEVDDVDLAIKILTEKGYMLLDGKHIPTPHPNQYGVYLSPILTGGILIELIYHDKKRIL